MATASPTLPPSAVVAQVLTASGVSASTQAKVNTSTAAVQRAAVTLCRIRPLASVVLNIGITLSPSLASVAESSVAQQVQGAATIACNALAVTPTYTALGRDQLVHGLARENERDVPVYGVRVR